MKRKRVSSQQYITNDGGIFGRQTRAGTWFREKQNLKKRPKQM